ncbi:MAG: SH3 domain-containing protein [Hyphomicrobium sp.]|nr:SH3 domain-containing protein [Hyphomicrobium sp.]
MRQAAYLVFAVLALACVQAWSVAGLVGPALAEEPASEEKQAFDAAKELGTVEAWDAFLSNYPKGFHADLARAYVKKLGEATPAAPVAPVAPAEPAFDYPMVAGTWGGIVRGGPGPGFEKVASLKEGEEVTLMGPGVPVQPNDYPWFKIAFRDGDTTGYMWGGILCSTGAERPDLFKLCTFTPVRTSGSSSDDAQPSTKKSSGSSKSSKPSKATVEKRAKASCADIGMIYLNGKCAPKKKSERVKAEKNKNKPCPAGMYRNPYGQCQPNETGG